MLANEDFPDSTDQHSLDESNRDDLDVTMCICPVCGYSASSPHEQDEHMEQAHGDSHGIPSDDVDVRTAAELNLSPARTEPPQDSCISSSGLQASSTPQRAIVPLDAGHLFPTGPLFCPKLPVSTIHVQPTVTEPVVGLESLPLLCNPDQSVNSSNLLRSPRICNKPLGISQKGPDDVSVQSKDALLVQKVDSRRRYRCNMCSSTFPWHGDLTEHLRIVHGMQKTRESSRNGKAGSFCCIHCKYVAKYQSELRRHMRLHWGVKPFVCVFCPYRSAWKGDLKRHMESHHRERFSSEADLVKIMSQFKNNAGTTVNGVPLLTTPVIDSTYHPGEAYTTAFSGAESISDESSANDHLPNSHNVTGFRKNCHFPSHITDSDEQKQSTNFSACLKREQLAPDEFDLKGYRKVEQSPLDHLPDQTKPSMKSAIWSPLTTCMLPDEVTDGITRSNLSKNCWLINSGTPSSMDTVANTEPVPIDLSIGSKNNTHENQQLQNVPGASSAESYRPSTQSNMFPDMISKVDKLRSGLLNPSISPWPLCGPLLSGKLSMETSGTPMSMLVNQWVMNGLLQSWQHQQLPQNQQISMKTDQPSPNFSIPVESDSLQHSAPSWNQVPIEPSSSWSPTGTRCSDDSVIAPRSADDTGRNKDSRSRRGRRTDRGNYGDGMNTSGMKEEQWKRHQCSGCGHRSNWKWDINKHIKVAHPERTNITTVTLDLEEAKRTFGDYMNRLKLSRNRFATEPAASNLAVSADWTRTTPPNGPYGTVSEGYYRPYKCSVCGHRSNWKWDVRKHIKQVHNNTAEVITLSLEEARRTIHQYKSCRRKQLRNTELSALKPNTQTSSPNQVPVSTLSFPLYYQLEGNQSLNPHRSDDESPNLMPLHPAPINLSCSSSSEPEKSLTDGLAVHTSPESYTNEKPLAGKIFPYLCQICRRPMRSFRSTIFHLLFRHRLQLGNCVIHVRRALNYRKNHKERVWKTIHTRSNPNSPRSDSTGALFKFSTLPKASFKRPRFLTSNTERRHKILYRLRRNSYSHKLAMNQKQTSSICEPTLIKESETPDSTVQQLSGLLDEVLGLLEVTESSSTGEDTLSEASKLGQVINQLTDVIQFTVCNHSMEVSSLNTSMSSNEENQPEGRDISTSSVSPIQKVLQHPDVGSRLLRFANVLRLISNTGRSNSIATPHTKQTYPTNCS